MIYTRHADGMFCAMRKVDCICVLDEGLTIGVAADFELHVNMWSEDFRRVKAVATEVQRRGVH